MHDSELKKLLIETCPIRPGQEERAWTATRDRLFAARPSKWAWLYLPSWRGAAVAAVALLAVATVGDMIALHNQHLAFVSARSQAPGIYATSFYSSSAQAQVVWLNGMDPASDKPSYLDPTTSIPAASQNSKSSADPNSL
jgi:anti-sigma-K factor RskA